MTCGSFSTNSSVKHASTKLCSWSPLKSWISSRSPSSAMRMEWRTGPPSIPAYTELIPPSLQAHQPSLPLHLRATPRELSLGFLNQSLSSLPPLVPLPSSPSLLRSPISSAPYSPELLTDLWSSGVTAQATLEHLQEQSSGCQTISGTAPSPLSSSSCTTNAASPRTATSVTSSSPRNPSNLF
jgi:hypothetical protein